MSDDSRSNPPPAPARQTVLAPLQPNQRARRRGYLTGMTSIFGLRWERRYFREQAETTQAAREVITEQTLYLQQYQKKEEELDRLRDLPNRLDEQQREREHQRETAAGNRELAALRQRQELAAAHADTERLAMERDLKYRTTLAKNQTALLEAQQRRWFTERTHERLRLLDPLLQPLRIKRTVELFETGALGAEVDRLLVEEQRNQQSGAVAGTPAPPLTEKDKIEALMAAVDIELANLIQSGASEEEKEVLRNFHRKLSMRL
jgi:hypothetical protein